MHLRDGCPFLPYAGRPIGGRSRIDGVQGSKIEVRAPSNEVLGNLWQVLWLDKTIRGAIVDAWRDIAQTFSVALGDTAALRHLVLLGESVPATTHASDMG